VVAGRSCCAELTTPSWVLSAGGESVRTIGVVVGPLDGVLAPVTVLRRGDVADERVDVGGGGGGGGAIAIGLGLVVTPTNVAVTG
jgi:hypothetical protein